MGWSKWKDYSKFYSDRQAVGADDASYIAETLWPDEESAAFIEWRSTWNIYSAEAAFLFLTYDS